MRSVRSTVLAGLGLWLAGCPGSEAPGLSDDGIAPGSSTGDRPGITTFNSTIDPTLPGDGDDTEAESVDVTTMGVADDTTTAPGSTTDPETTTEPGSTTDASTSNSSDSGSTSDSSSSGPGSTTGDVCNGVPGNYGSCVNMGGAIDTTPCMAPGDATCIYTGMLALPSADVCAIEDCVDACDCPAAPASGSAVAACGDVTGNPADLFCYLDCSGGETCPTGMTCVGDFFCVWPGPGAAGTPYGDCLPDLSVCGLDGVCLNNGAMPTIGVCTEACNVAGDCPASPGGTAPVTCSDLTGDGASECFLNCATGQTCPAGMSCFQNTLCAWN